MKLTEAGEIDALIGALWPNRKVPTQEAIVAQHQLLLQYWPKHIIVDAIQTLADQGREFAPSISEVVAKAKKLSAPASDFDTAWDEIMLLGRKYGWRRIWHEEALAEWKDPVMQRVVFRYGAQKLFTIEESQLSYERSHLKKVYEEERQLRERAASMLMRGEVPAQLPPAEPRGTVEVSSIPDVVLHGEG